MSREVRCRRGNSVPASDLSSRADVCMVFSALLLRAATGRCLYPHTVAAWRLSGVVHVQLKNDTAMLVVGLEHRVMDECDQVQHYSPVRGSLTAGAGKV